MHPILFRIGSFTLHTYGVLLALALLAGILVAVRLGRREGIDSGRVLDLSVWLIISGLIGAKIYMILTGWVNGPVALSGIFSIGTLEAGGGFYGGFIGAALFAVWYVRTRHLPLLKVFDAFAPAVALGQAIGRVGCFMAGDDFGKPAHHSWLGVAFTSPYAETPQNLLGVPLYPVQLFESVLTLIIFLILIWFYTRKTRDGQIFVMYLMMYAVARFFLEYYRGDTDRGIFFHGALSTAQLVAIAAFVLGIILILNLRKPRAPAESPRSVKVTRAR
ncbi:MAG: prolipoprotein diacylglyceryl transferase [Terriglobia bacterium]